MYNGCHMLVGTQKRLLGCLRFATAIEIGFVQGCSIMADETQVFSSNANPKLGVNAGGAGPSSSLHPVWESMREELSRSGGQWLSDLARWYEADWLVALRGGPKPAPQNILQVLAPEKRVLVESVLSSIDVRYSEIIEEMNRVTVPNYDAPTAIVPSRQPEELPPTISPDQPRPAMDETIHLTQGATATDMPQDLTLGHVERTMDFSHGIPNPQTLDFSVGEKIARPKSTSAPSSDMSTAIPNIAGYRIDRILGRGGMGVVYLGHQLGIERPVAIKMIIGGNFAAAATIERFKAEARAVGKLNHEHIVRIYDSGWHEGMPYFSLEYVEGTNLSEKINGQPLDPVESARFAAHLAGALDYAHNAGIVHRDLKPANVLLSSTGVPKLTDFGLAKLEDEQNAYSQTGDVVGTPGYMAPEQALGDDSVGAAADVYGLGAILYCMLSGRPPFMAAKASDTLIQLLSNDPIPVAKLQPSIPRDLETICMKCLEKEPTKRYGSAKLLHDELQRFIQGEPILARPISQVERGWRWAKRKPMVAGLSATAAALGAVLMIGGPVVAFVIDGQKRDISSAKQLAEDNAEKATVAQKEAEANALLAKANEQEAEQNAQQAEENAKQAAANEKIAQEQQRNAIDALKSLVFEVQRELKDRPRLQSLRQQLLDVASDGLKRIDSSNATAPARNIIMASIYRRLGDIHFEIGSADAAVAEYKKCLEVLESLKSAGNLPGARHNMSTIYDLLGDSSRRASKYSDAEKYWQLSLAERRAWLVESNNNLDVLQNVASVLGKLVILSREQGNLVAARTYLEETLKYREEYLKQRPGQFDPQDQLLGTQRELALLRFYEGDEAAGAEEMKKVIAKYDELANLNRDSQAVQWNSALFKSDLATQLLYARQLDESVKLFEAAIKIQQRMVDEDPEKLQFRQGLAGSLYGLATAYNRRGDREKSLAVYAQALKLAEEVLEHDPENLSRLIRVALFRARAQKIAEAREIVEPITGAGLEPTTLYDLAGVYAQLSMVGETAAVDEKDSIQARSARETAIKLLRDAKAAGFDRPMDLQRDPDLDPLRSEEAFQMLLTKL